MFQTHKSLYFVLAIIGAAAVAVGLLLAIQNFKTGEEVASFSPLSNPSRQGEGIKKSSSPLRGEAGEGESDTAEENPNIDDAKRGNYIAHKTLSTFKFIES